MHERIREGWIQPSRRHIHRDRPSQRSMHRIGAAATAWKPQLPTNSPLMSRNKTEMVRSTLTQASLLLHWKSGTPSICRHKSTPYGLPFTNSTSGGYSQQSSHTLTGRKSKMVNFRTKLGTIREIAKNRNKATSLQGGGQDRDENEIMTLHGYTTKVNGTFQYKTRNSIRGNGRGAWHVITCKSDTDLNKKREIRGQ